ncbi:MAG: threonine synthase [Ilumatobacteraceae bacterium]
MRYVSTRGASPELGFGDVLLAGLADDGGLYVPVEWPAIDTGPSDEYADVAASVLAPYVAPDLTEVELVQLCRDSYAGFRHPEIAPLVEIGDDQWLLELFHGPTLAFKDMALQLVGRMFDRLLERRDERITIVGATSGDTGSAAIEGVRGCERVQIVILYPEGRTSEVQRRQMTTVDAPNVHTLAVDGTFDDCQDLVKAMFADRRFRESQRLSAVNSINWARIIAQTAYHASAASRMGRPIDICVPTGNFGNVLAGWIARHTGAEIDRLLVATNSNDILTRFIRSRDMTTAGVVPTLSPSMDIQVSSNFERLLFEMNDRDGERTAADLAQFRSDGHLDTSPEAFDRWIRPVFDSSSVDDAETLAEIARVHRETGMLIDPHTATGTVVARRLAGNRPVVTLATAHPAKFPDAVRQATGVHPELPDELADLFDRPERITPVANDLAAVEALVAERCPI